MIDNASDCRSRGDDEEEFQKKNLLSKCGDEDFSSRELKSL